MNFQYSVFTILNNLNNRYSKSLDLDQKIYIIIYLFFFDNAVYLKLVIFSFGFLILHIFFANKKKYKKCF